MNNNKYDLQQFYNSLTFFMNFEFFSVLKWTYLVKYIPTYIMKNKNNCTSIVFASYNIKTNLSFVTFWSFGKIVFWHFVNFLQMHDWITFRIRVMIFILPYYCANSLPFFLTIHKQQCNAGSSLNRNYVS